MSEMLFSDFPFDPRILSAIEALGFEHTTPIQAEAFTPLLAGHNVIGGARTGSGKTAAFGLPLLQRLIEGGTPPRALVLAPTRELAMQVSEALRTMAKKLPVRIATVYGGAPYPPQFQALKTATVVVGTPGRLLDHLDKGSLDLSAIEVFVLDEADEMLRMGFIDDVNKLLGATPSERQVALFSATMPAPIRRIVRKHIGEVVEVQVEAQALTTSHIQQQWMRVPRRFKVEALIRVLQGTHRGTTLVFCRTRADCAKVADELARRGVAADALHGDLNQSARERVLARMRSGRLDVVIATDVAARGIDVEHITHVINFDLPGDTEVYVHRIGRTGRVGRVGTAITFATPKEKRHIKDIARRLGVPIDHVDVPSDAAILRQRRQQLAKQVTEALGNDLAEASAWLAEAFAEVPAADVAAAALALLAGPETFEAMPEDQPPIWARKVTSSWDSRDGPTPGNQPWKDNNEVELFFPIGRQHDMRPGDFVGALANEAGIDGRLIGRVNIFDRKTFVGVSRDTAGVIMERLDGIEIRGNQVPMTIAHPRKGNDAKPRYSKKRKFRPGKGNRGYDRGRGRS